MKILWLCNMIPSAVSSARGAGSGGGLWIDHVLEDIRAQKGITLRLLCPGGEETGRVDGQTDYALFTEGAPQHYRKPLEDRFCEMLASFAPDVIHIWGTEYGHTLAMVNAAWRLNLQSRVVISIQGLCSIYARHYSEGVPEKICRRYSLRDFLKQDNIIGQRRRFAQRGKLECMALEKTGHVIGRTDWDRAATAQINPSRIYHFCSETLRQPFYEGCWQYAGCTKHRIFSSSSVYPVKGFHYLLEAMPAILREYPDAEICVTGGSFFAHSFAAKQKQSYYHRYLARLARKNHLEDKIHFLGQLDAQRMKQAFLDANVFVLPSTIENSPNSLGEAMLLGVPCVAADVGGVANMMQPGQGYVYQSTAPYMLAEYVLEVFRQQSRAEAMGRAARVQAQKTHDPQKNLQDLLHIYTEIAQGECAWNIR